MIAERAGQPLSLLVLDEVFGPLDEDRKGRMLAALVGWLAQRAAGVSQYIGGRSKVVPALLR